MPLKQIVLPFPLKGLNEATAYVDQPRGQYDPATGNTRGGTTASCVNVTAYDPRTGRNRGASRCGITKFFSAQINGSAPVQEINHVVGVDETSSRYLEDGTVRILETGVARDLETSTLVGTGRRFTTIVGVAGGTAKTFTTSGSTAIVSGASALSSTAYTILSTQFGTDLYFADGSNYKYLDVSANLMTPWTASAGSMPMDDNGNRATLICTWHGRIVLAGIVGDPQNWFMSAVDTPDDFDYGAVASPTMAVAGNNSDAGLVGDIITALVPFNDDVLIFGGDHTIWRMTGDPADGGRIDRVSDIVGFAAGRAWCKSPEGIVYFFGSRGGIYRMDPASGGQPNRLSANSIDERLSDVNTDDNTIRLEWDDRAIAVRIFITPNDGSATLHYCWDVRNEGWFPFSYDNDDHNPMAVHLMDGYDPDDRVILLGGQDGYVRYINADVDADDGNPIKSEVFIGPFSNMIILEMMPVFSSTSGNVTWSIFSGTTHEEALASIPVASGKFQAGRGRSQFIRRHIHNGYIRLSSSEPWSLERITLSVMEDTQQRRRTWS